MFYFSILFGNLIIPTDVFQRAGEKPPTSSTGMPTSWKRWCSWIGSWLKQCHAIHRWLGMVSLYHRKKNMGWWLGSGYHGLWHTSCNHMRETCTNTCFWPMFFFMFFSTYQPPFSRMCHDVSLCWHRGIHVAPADDPCLGTPEIQETQLAI